MTAAAEPTPETSVDTEVVDEQPIQPGDGQNEGAESTPAASAPQESASVEPASETPIEPAPAEPEESDSEAPAEPVSEASAEPVPDESEAPAEPAAEASSESALEESSEADAREPVVAAPAGSDEPWGRVDDDGTVSVREGDQWRVVGQFPDGPAEEALAYFERKYADLASEVGLLEVRHRRAGASASDLRGTARIVRDKIVGAAAVGDLASLEARVAALTDELTAATESEAAAAREAVDAAIAKRTGIVEKAEALAARDPKSVQWKQASAEMTALFDAWQSEQRTGPRLPKSTGQQLWKRFRDARATLDKHRREFYAELDEAHKIVRDRKTKLVEKAEALAPKGEDGIGAYRELLEQWKTAGRAGKKADDALWVRFKAAGDALYGARGEREAAEAEESREKIAQKRALLDEAKAVADEPEIAKARQLLTGIQRRWDEIGRIFPRDAERGLDDDLRKIEQGLRTREDTDWKRNNPETKARANDMSRQLMEAIEKLEQELETAKKSGDKAAVAKATEALEARKGWLKAVGG